MTQVLFDRLKSNLAQCINDGTIYFVKDSNGNFTQIALGDGSKSHVVGIGPKMDDTTKQEFMSKLGLTISSNMETIQLGKLANQNGVSSQKKITYERMGLGTDTHEISTVGYVQQYLKTAKAMVYAGVFNAQTKEITDYNTAIISPSEEGNVTFDYLIEGYEGETLLTPGMSFIVGVAGDLEGYTGISVYGGQTKVEVGDMIIIINVQQKESEEGGSTYNEASILVIQNTNLNIADGAITTAKLADESVTASKLSTDIQPLIRNLSKTATFAGIATPTTNPGTPDGPVFYIANGKGTYTNFGGIDVTEDEVVVLYYDTVWHKEATGIASNDKLTELETKTNHKVFSNGAIFNSMFSEVYFVGFTNDEIASITRVAYAIIRETGALCLNFTINGVVESFGTLVSYSSGINYLGHMKGNQIDGKRGLFVVANGNFSDAAEKIQIYSSVLDIAQSPSISEHILNLTPQNNILVNLEFAETSKRISLDGNIVDANSNWAYTKPIAVTKGDLLKINTEGNATAAVLAKTDVDGSYYETIIAYNDQTKDYQLLIDFDGYVALSIYHAFSHHLYKVQSPIIKAVVSLIGEQPTELVSVQSIEQIVTSTESGGVNVIECILTNGTRTQFYIRNGIGENGGIAVPNFNSIQLLPQRKFKKPLVTIKASEKKWTPSVVSDANVDNTTREIYDEVYQKMTEVEWVESLNKALMKYDLPTRIDMSKKVVCGSLYLDEDIADTGTMGETYIKIYSGGINDTEHSLFVKIQFAGSGNESYQRTGWFHFCVCPQANASSKGAAFDIADVHRIAIHQMHTSASVQFGIGDFYIVDGMQKGGVVMLIDNFNPNVPTMADYIASKGLKATLSIVPSWIGNDNLHGTLEQINKCAADGHFIINHTWTHNISNEQTAEEIFDEISKADKWMVRNGFARGSKIVSNPSAAHDLNKYRAYMNSEALMIYHHWTTPGGGNNFTLYYPYYPMSRLLNITALESSGVDYMINAVDKAVEVGGIAVLGWHGTWYDAENGEADFKRLIDHIASLGSECTCYLVDDLIEGAYL